MTHGRPWVQGCPLEVSKEPNDTKTCLVSIFSVFNTENEHRVNKPLEFQTRLPWGDPWASLGPGVPLGGVQRTHWYKQNLFFNLFLGGFWHLSQLKFEEISPKIPRIQILRKLAPLLVPFTVPTVPLGDQKNFWEVSGIYLSSSLKKYHQKYQEYRF